MLFLINSFSRPLNAVYAGCLLLPLCAGCDKPSKTAAYEPKANPIALTSVSIKPKVAPNKLTALQAVKIAKSAVARHEGGPGHLICRTDKTWKEEEIWWVLIDASHVNRHGRTIPTSVNYGNPARLIAIDSRGEVINYSYSD